MSVRTCWLPAVLLVVCLHSVSGTLADDHNQPTAIDQGIMKANEGKNFTKSTRMGNDRIIDGMDLLLSKEQYEKLYRGSRRKFEGRGDDEFLRMWPEGVIPYWIHNNFDQQRVNQIRQGMDTWEALTCVRFQQGSGHESNGIDILDDGGCYSLLGMHPTQWQPLSLDYYGCFGAGTVEHELGHAMGMVHEHQRPERDDYLKVFMNNVQQRYTDQLTAYESPLLDKMGLSYDYDSVMHYSSYAFSIDPYSKRTIIAYDRQTGQELKDKTESLGHAPGPSFLDVKLINLMYKCGASCQPKPSCSEDCFVDQHCKCFCKDDMSTVDQGPGPGPGQSCEDEDRDCQYWAAQYACEMDPDYMLRYCRKSCGQC